MNLLYVHTHLLHDLHTIAEAEDDAFLCGSYDVCTVVLVEVDAMDRTTDLLVFEDTLSAIAEGDNLHAITSDRYTGSKVVHVCITYVWSNVTMNPSVENTCSVDAEQHTEAVEVCGIVGMSKGIDTTLRVVVHIAQHTVDDARSTGGTCYFSRVEDIEADSIVGLVACTIRDRCSLLQSEFVGSSLRHYALYGECRNDICQHTLVKTEVVEQEVGGFLLLEVPHHTFRQSADSGLHFARKFHGEVVARKHDLVDAVKDIGFILLDPRQFGSGKVTGRVEEAAQAQVFAQVVESFLAIRHGARVTPDDTGAEHLLILVHTHQSVHLIRDTDGKDILTLGTCLRHDFAKRQLGVVPPHLWILLCPSCLHRRDGCLMIRIEC